MPILVDLLIIGAIVCFFLAVIGVPAAIDLIALGLLLWAVASCFGAHGLTLILLIAAAIAFLLATVKLAQPKINWIALGLLLWMVALLLGAVLK